MDIDETDTVSQDITKSGTISTISKGLSKEFTSTSPQGGSDSVATSEVEANNWHFSDTRSNSGQSRSSSQTLSHGSSSTQDNRIADSVYLSRAVSRQAAHSNSRTDSKTKTDSERYRVDESYASTNENSLTNSFNEEKAETESRTSEKSKSYSISVSTDQTFKVKPGNCKILVCFPMVISMVVPFECLGSNNKTNDIVPTEVMFIKSSSKMGKLNFFILIRVNTDLILGSSESLFHLNFQFI